MGKILPAADKPAHPATSPRRWAALNLNSPAKLPPPGAYQACISVVKLTDRSDVLWAAIEYALEGTDARPRGDIGAIAATAASPHLSRVPDGLRLLHRLSQASGVEINGVDPFKLPALLIGKRVTLTLGHRERDGQPELVVREIRPPA